MDRPELPRPINTQDTYLHDIASSLRTLVDRYADGREPSKLEQSMTGIRDSIRIEEPAPARRLKIKHTGGGWYEIRDGDQVVAKVRGQDAAEARLAELGG